MIKFRFVDDEFTLKNGRVLRANKELRLISQSFDFIKTGPEIPDRDSHLFEVKLKPLGAEMIENIPEKTRSFAGEIN